MIDSYESAAKRHDDRYADLAVGKRNWQLAASAFALLAFAAGATAWRLAGQEKIKPYLVEVDRFGDVRGVVQPVHPDAIDIDVKKAQVAEFIRDCRTITGNPEQELHYHVKVAYARVRGRGLDTLKQYDLENNPFELGTKLTRTVTVTSVMPLADRPQSYEVTWNEQDTILHVGPSERDPVTHWSAHLETATGPVTESNPLGLYVTSISWTKIQDQANAS